MKERYPSEQQDRVMVRLPDGMHRKIKDAAKAANRNMTQEIVARLEASFNDSASSSSDTDNLRDRLRQVEGRLWALEQKSSS